MSASSVAVNTFVIEPISKIVRSSGAYGRSSATRPCPACGSDNAHVLARLLREHAVDAERKLSGTGSRDEYGASRARTGDLLAASQTLSQLSYGPRSASLASRAGDRLQLTPSGLG